MPRGSSRPPESVDKEDRAKEGAELRTFGRKTKSKRKKSRKK